MMSRKLKILITCSALLNLILIGWVGSSVVKHHGWHSPSDDKMVESLPPELRDDVEEVFEESREQARILWQDLKEAKSDLRAALNADQFNEEEYDQASSRLNNLWMQMMQLKAIKTKEVAKRLPAIDRRKLAGHLMRGGHHKMGGWRQPKMDKTSADFSAAPDKFKGQDDPHMTPIPE